MSDLILCLFLVLKKKLREQFKTFSSYCTYCNEPNQQLRCPKSSLKRGIMTEFLKHLLGFAAGPFGLSPHHTVKVRDFTAERCAPCTKKNRLFYSRAGPKVSTDCRKGHKVQNCTLLLYCSPNNCCCCHCHRRCRRRTAEGRIKF